LVCGSAFALAGPSSGVQLSLDVSEAEQALRIIRKGAAGVTAEDWQQLFGTVPYQQLKAREAAMGRPLADEDFQKFLLSPTTLAKQPEWEQALAEMKQSDIGAIGERVLAWLPAGAAIHARVFPEIKPSQNSFVWTMPGSDPAIFLYLEQKTRAQFENTVAHECHHIGLQSLHNQQDAIRSKLPENVKEAVNWMSAFGEGEAMLAAAGSVDRHPHWEDDAITRARWDGDLMHFNFDVAALQQFFTEILDGKLHGDDEIMRRAAPFWGDAQGAWYTVGYEMAVLVEREYGRPAFVECLIDPRKLLALYNQIAVRANAKGATMATWSSEFLTRLAN
jgi:hypothetical protein